jgi:ubiquinone/menaquinone biosynthesis C-methylase UbiE
VRPLLATQLFAEQISSTYPPFPQRSFEHVFECFVLEHLDQALKRVLKPDGTITVIEGDHGSTYFYPPQLAQLN